MRSKAVKGEDRGFGGVPVPSLLDRDDNDDQCEVDAIDFVFRQSK